MKKLPKIFLIISVTAFLTEFTEAGSDLGWGILKPLSAIFFILFFMTNLMAKEMEAFDQEQHSHLSSADRKSPVATSHPTKYSPQEGRKHSGLTATGSR